MEITLNRANKLRSQLEKIEGPKTGTIGLSTSDPQYEKKYIEGVDKFESEGAQVIQAIKHAYTLRGIIDEANHRTEISDLMRQLAMKKVILAKLMGIYGLTNPNQAMRYRGGMAFQDFVQEVEFRNNQNEPDRPQRLEVIFPAFDEQAIIDWKREIMQLEEERNAANYNTRVSLPDELVEFCKGLGLL